VFFSPLCKTDRSEAEHLHQSGAEIERHGTMPPHSLYHNGVGVIKYTGKMFIFVFGATALSGPGPTYSRGF
jgi:hypothetical protein